MRDTGAWGGEPEILALSRAYNIPVHVIQGSSPPIVVHEPSDSFHGTSPKVVRISYHRRMYGLGEVRQLRVFSRTRLIIITLALQLLTTKESWKWCC